MPRPQHTSSSKPYIGRFAPSPTGPLHIGSLIAAVGSYLDAKAHHGKWLLRIEDLDPPRERRGATDSIIESLITHGLHWDDEIFWQSQQNDNYQSIIDQLLAEQKAYYCCCSRSAIQAGGGIYQGHCRGQTTQPKYAASIRLWTQNLAIGFVDDIQGPYQQQVEQAVGDFIIRRKDQLIAYQLAVVVDDAQQGITHVVRGSDLLDSTPRQIFLQQQLEFGTPHYCHLPIITNNEGQKLSKQTFARALSPDKAEDNLLQALFFLGQPLPPKTKQTNCRDILVWAIDHWDLALIPTVRGKPQSILARA